LPLEGFGLLDLLPEEGGKRMKRTPPVRVGGRREGGRKGDRCVPRVSTACVERSSDLSR